MNIKPLYLKSLSVQILIVIMIIILPKVSFCQNIGEVENLRNIIDSLENELDICKNSIAYKLLDFSRSETTFTKDEVYTYNDLRQKLIYDIENENKAGYDDAYRTMGKVDSFSIFIENLKENLIVESGGFDERGYPKNKGDRVTVNRILIEEEKGILLKNYISILHSDLEMIIDQTFDKDLIVIDSTNTPEDKDSWAEYKFKNMPLAAVLPLLNQIKMNAQAAEINVLKWIYENKD